MAKYRHRTFEMFDFLDEAAAALAAKPRDPLRPSNEVDTNSYEQLKISFPNNIAHIQFNTNVSSGEESESGLRSELTRLAESLLNDSRVIVDFEGMDEFSSASIEALETFYQRLKSKGSRLILCNLQEDAKTAFYPKRVAR